MADHEATEVHVLLIEWFLGCCQEGFQSEPRDYPVRM